MKRYTDIPINEIILRKYEKPYNLKDRDLVRKLCLSLGLLQPGDSRDIIVDVLYVLLKARKEQKLMSSKEIMEGAKEVRKNNNLKMYGIAHSNIRRQIRRLKDAMIVEKVSTKYRIIEFDNLENIFNQKIKDYILKSTLERVVEYLKKIDEEL